MNGDTYLDVELIDGTTTYADTARYDVVKLMMKADIVNVRGASLYVDEVEVTDEGVVKFYGKQK